MLDIPCLEEGVYTLHQRGHHLVFPCDHPSEIVADWSLHEQPYVRALFDLVAKFDDRQERFTGNAAPIQTDAAERMGLNDRDTGAELGGPDRGNIPTRSSAENGDVLRHGNESMFLC